MCVGNESESPSTVAAIWNAFLGRLFHFSDGTVGCLVSGIPEPFPIYIQRFLLSVSFGATYLESEGGHVSHSESSSGTMYHIVAIFQ
jgi:hypothetical protein